MKRFAFKMALKPGCIDEYRRRHDRIWPELAAVIREQGITDYSIYFDEATGSLFAVQKQAGTSSSQELGKLEIVQRWWRYMADLMETNPDNSPVSIPLVEVFRLD